MICIESITEKGGENLPFFVGRLLYLPNRHAPKPLLKQ